MVALWLLILTLVVFSFFWYNQLVYLLPTPVPASYKQVHTGERIVLPESVAVFSDPSKPLLLHFFNPDCPCSRFNITQFKELVKKYENDVKFVVVLMTDKKYQPKDIQKRFGIAVPVIENNMLAASCGVYSTPQAVVLTETRNLFYRGNYNKSRYCTDEATSYARIALDGVIRHQNNLKFDALALKAYGCILPNCGL